MVRRRRRRLKPNTWWPLVDLGTACKRHRGNPSSANPCVRLLPSPRPRYNNKMYYVQVARAHGLLLPNNNNNTKPEHPTDSPAPHPAGREKTKKHKVKTPSSHFPRAARITDDGFRHIIIRSECHYYNIITFAVIIIIII